MPNFRILDYCSDGQLSMSFDPRFFSPMVVTDTCSVWNILSARRLYSAAKSARLTFCITPMVLYECIRKPRKQTTREKEELIQRFATARDSGAFPVHHCDLDDLVAVCRIAPAALSSGELSCIAMAYKIRTMAVMTDERQARRFAEEKLGLRVETTPRLYGWLHFNRHLSDGDHPDVLAEHDKYERRPLTEYFKKAYESALQYRLMAQQSSAQPPAQ